MGVVLGTKEVLRRMWCAGEITTAMGNKVPVLIVMCDDWQNPDEAFLNQLESAWTADERHTLNAFGLLLPRIHDAYRQVPFCRSVKYQRFTEASEQEAVISSIMGRTNLSSCDAAKQQVSFIKGASSSMTTAFSLAGEKRYEAVVTGNALDAEAISTCQLLRQLLIQQSGHEIGLVLTAQAHRELPQAATAAQVIVVLTKGLLREPEFAGLLLHVYAQEAPIFTVLADRHFDFPGPEFHAKIQL